MRQRLIALSICVAVAGCGGAGNASAPLPQPSILPAASPANVHFHILVPSVNASEVRRPAYVSASTKSASIAVAPAVGSAGAPVIVNCTNVCSGTVGAPVGNDTFTVNLYDAQNAGGNVLSTGTLAQTIVANQTNTVNLTFDGVVASLAVSLNPVVIPPGTSGSVAVGVNALDADGNVIVGPGHYVNANGNGVTVTLSDSDTSGASQLSTSSLTAPTSGITLAYTSVLGTAPTITASASGITAAHASLQFAAPTLTSLGTTQGLIGTAVSETLSGTNFTPASTVSVTGSLVTVGAVTVNGSTSITAHLFIDPEAAPGARSVTVSTAGGTSAPQTFTISTAGADVVTLATDTSPGTPAGTGSGATGDLRYAMQHANAGDTIVFDTTKMCGATDCTISLAGPLPPISQNLTIDGGEFGRVIVDGGSTYRAFWVANGTVRLANLQIQHALAQGGNGGPNSNPSLSYGGGGGAGLGAGLFVEGGTVSVLDDYFLDDRAVGGNGGSGDVSPNSGEGGGGLGGSGGSGDDIYGGGGGGGVLGSGGNGVSGGGGTGGAGFGGIGGIGGAYQMSGGSFGANGAPGAGGGGGGGSSLGIGGSGGFGAGGGGGGGVGGIGGGGGFGGGGGAGDGSPGNGGQGGGGAGAYGGPGGLGGTLFGSIAGGHGDSSGDGGGGAAAGPAIFVYGGSITTLTSGASGSSSVGGQAGGAAPGPSGATAGTADPTPLFNFGGAVNGSSTLGPIASALSNAAP